MGKDDWRTESWLLDYFRDWDDPCPNEGTDGLLREWGERVYAQSRGCSITSGIGTILVRTKGRTAS